MSDHFSGPRSLSDPAADITDVFAFPCPDSPQHLVLAMDVFGKAGPSALFSDAVIYRFRVRPAAIAETGPICWFATGTEEAIFDCVLEVPSSLKAGAQPIQHGRCMTPSGE